MNDILSGNLYKEVLWEILSWTKLDDINNIRLVNKAFARNEWLIIMKFPSESFRESICKNKVGLVKILLKNKLVDPSSFNTSIRKASFCGYTGVVVIKRWTI